MATVVNIRHLPQDEQLYGVFPQKYVITKEDGIIVTSRWKVFGILRARSIWHILKEEEDKLRTSQSQINLKLHQWNPNIKKYEDITYQRVS